MELFVGLLTFLPFEEVDIFDPLDPLDATLEDELFLTSALLLSSSFLVPFKLSALLESHEDDKDIVNSLSLSSLGTFDERDLCSEPQAMLSLISFFIFITNWYSH